MNRDPNQELTAISNQFFLNVPFNIGKTGWIWQGISLKNGTANFKQSIVKVHMTPLLPNVEVNQVTPSFDAVDLSGNLIHFPADFRQKVVLIDFWATWNSTSIKQLDQLRSIYAEYQPRGFDIIGVSLDKPKELTKINEVVASHKFNWSQIYDGKFWQARVGKQFNVASCPDQILVDCATGKILATQSELNIHILKLILKKLLN